MRSPFRPKQPLQALLRKHFGNRPAEEIVTAGRDFPVTSRVDLQIALEQRFADRPVKLLGISAQHNHETLTITNLLTVSPFGVVGIGPLQHDEIDIGDDAPVRCLQNGLWLDRHEQTPFAVLLSPAARHGMSIGTHVEIALPAGTQGLQFSNDFFRDLERVVASAHTYRGRVLSLESFQNFSGVGGAVKVHRLRPVSREEVILPAKTLSLLDRNIINFAAAREGIKKLQFSSRKGILFYGPPGTGKTHTIHYLASRLPGHTTLLVTAEQVGIIGEYFRLARFFQPSIMIVEDVDLIARERSQLHNPGQEILLNKLLNEMDGLREDADVLFILTTNRPEQLEPALAARPGRIDQAIEFPLPDAEGRRRLVSLYARKLDVPAPLLELLIRRTEGASAAFIKEFMRRSAQFQLEFNMPGPLSEAAVNGAFEEMVFTGGALNLKLLGGASGLHDSGEA